MWPVTARMIFTRISRPRELRSRHAAQSWPSPSFASLKCGYDPCSSTTSGCTCDASARRPSPQRRVASPRACMQCGKHWVVGRVLGGRTSDLMLITTRGWQSTRRCTRSTLRCGRTTTRRITPTASPMLSSGVSSRSQARPTLVLLASRSSPFSTGRTQAMTSSARPSKWTRSSIRSFGAPATARALHSPSAM